MTIPKQAVAVEHMTIVERLRNPQWKSRPSFDETTVLDTEFTRKTMDEAANIIAAQPLMGVEPTDLEKATGFVERLRKFAPRVNDENLEANPLTIRSLMFDVADFLAAIVADEQTGAKP